KSGPLPPLATRTRGAAPLLGAPGTRDLFGPDVDLSERSGGRFVVGLPFNEARTTGLEAGYFFLGSRTATLLAAGTTDPSAAVLGRPYLDANTGQEAAAIISAPGFMAGELRAAQTARAQGVEV